MYSSMAQTKTRSSKREAIFARFRKYKIIVNPKKTELGLEEVEFVGHLVSHKGVSFTKEKRQKMQNFERPRTHEEMFMYIGVVNYFHDHVRNMNDLLRPLEKWWNDTISTNA